MWEQSGGGFMNDSVSGADTPGQSGGAKKQRAQNIVPVHIEEILNLTGDAMTVEGQDVGMVVLVAQVKQVENQATKTIYTLEDDTGSISAVHWVEEGQENTSANVSENMYCRLVGAVRSSGDKKHVMVFKITQIENEDEIKAHPLEVTHAKLKIRQLQNMENQSIGANSMSNSMMNFGSSMGGGATSMSGGNSFGSAKQDMVYKMIQACKRDEGMNKDELLAQLKGKIIKSELDSALEFLSGEGHVYSTIDDDHFKAIDG